MDYEAFYLREMANRFCVIDDKLKDLAKEIMPLRDQLEDIYASNVLEAKWYVEQARDALKSPCAQLLKRLYA